MVRGVSEKTIERLRQLMLDEQPRSCAQAGPALGISESSAGHAMKELHRRKLVYVLTYARAGKTSNWTRVFKIGNEKDARRPGGPDKGKRAWLAREREWLKASRAKPVKPFRHPQDVALFGEYRSAA